MHQRKNTKKVDNLNPNEENWVQQTETDSVKNCIKNQQPKWTVLELITDDW